MTSHPVHRTRINLSHPEDIRSILQRHFEYEKEQALLKQQPELEVVRFAGASNLFKTFSVHTTAGIILLIVSLTSAYTIIYEQAREEDKSWARTTLTSMGTGVIGFLFGQKELENAKTRNQESGDKS